MYSSVVENWPFQKPSTCKVRLSWWRFFGTPGNIYEKDRLLKNRKKENVSKQRREHCGVHCTTRFFLWLPWHFGMRNSRCGETFIWFSPGKMWPLTTNNLSGCPGGSAKKEPECSCIVALELWQCRGNWCHKNDVSKLIGTGRATSDRDPTYWVTEFRLL